METENKPSFAFYCFLGCMAAVFLPVFFILIGWYLLTGMKPAEKHGQDTHEQP